MTQAPDIRKELETLRALSEQGERLAPCEDSRAVLEGLNTRLAALLQRIPEGWELRPREPSGVMLAAAEQDEK